MAKTTKKSKKNNRFSAGEKVILAIVIPIMIALILFIGLETYNLVKGYGWNELPDRTVMVRYNAQGLNLRSVGEVRFRSQKKAKKALHELGNIAVEQAQYGVKIIAKDDIKQINNSENIYSNDPDTYSTAAYFNPGDNTIVISDSADADWCLCHEMGHYVDHNYLGTSKITDDEHWIEITNAEYQNTGWDLYYSRPSEYWAECFAAYYCDPVWLYQTCPWTYNVIDGVVAEYENPSIG